MGQNPTVMDPHERKSVFVKTSLIPGSDEGLFARRAFSPGEIVSYFSGQRTFSSVMFHTNMTEEEELVTAGYNFDLEKKKSGLVGISRGNSHTTQSR